MENPYDAYMKWKDDPTPDNLSNTIKSLEPTLNSEITRYKGPAPLLKAKAKVLAANAIKTYDPLSGAKLQSWTTTQLQPLSRYGTQLMQQVSIPERVTREAAELDTKSKEYMDLYDVEPTDAQLSDFAAINPARIKRIRDTYKQTIGDSVMYMAQSSSIDAGIGDDRLQAAAALVANDLDERDAFIYKHRIGLDGAELLPANVIAQRLGISPAAVTQRASAIGQRIAEAREYV